MTPAVPPFSTLDLPLPLTRDLRSDHAGEAGAVRIYDGILAISRNPEVRRFAAEHSETERRHLAFFDAWLPRRVRSRLLPLWRAAGWMLGATAAVFGSRAVFRTIAAVESFVDGHYREQIETLRDLGTCDALADQLEAFRDDEVEHRDDAARRFDRSSSLLGDAWGVVIEAGSAAGVAVARRV